MAKLKLTQNQFAIVDQADFEHVTKHKWQYNGGYARRSVYGKTRTQVLMHRAILERSLGRCLNHQEQVDHINGDRLDNRRSNLRVASQDQNMRNKRQYNTLGYTGVSKHKKRFQAKIHFDCATFYIGSFPTVEEAAWMRDQWAIELHGEFAALNLDYVVSTNATFDLSAFVEKSTSDSGVPPHVSDPAVLALVAQAVVEQTESPV